MLTVSVILLAYAALSGLVMAVRIGQGARPYLPLALGHGAMAVMAVVLVWHAATGAGAGRILRFAAAALALAALAGFYLLSFHIRRRAHPIGIVLMHALVGAAGLGCLLFYWL